MPAEDAPPTAADVLARLNAILLGDAPRAAVAAWAAGWVAAEPATFAPATWQLLRLAASVDLRSPAGEAGEGPFLHSDADIRDWIESAEG